MKYRKQYAAGKSICTIALLLVSFSVTMGIIGEQPGGGDCVVAYYIDAYGHVGAISGFKQLGNMDGDTFTSDETAVVVDIPFEGNEGDDIYFKPEMIAKFVADHAA